MNVKRQNGSSTPETNKNEKCVSVKIETNYSRFTSERNLLNDSHVLCLESDTNVFILITSQKTSELIGIARKNSIPNFHYYARVPPREGISLQEFQIQDSEKRQKDKEALLSPLVHEFAIAITKYALHRVDCRVP